METRPAHPLHSFRCCHRHLSACFCAPGPHRGRLVIPCDHIEAGTKRYFSHVIFSDDHGKTWKLGGSSTQDQVNECEVVELTGNCLVLNMRNYDRTQRTRRIAIGYDGGASWTDPRHAPELIEPICQASIRRYAWLVEGQKGILIFSNPASTRRENMTVRLRACLKTQPLRRVRARGLQGTREIARCCRPGAPTGPVFKQALSENEGQTWPATRQLHAGPSVYSCLAVLLDKAIGCFDERGEKSPYETITFARTKLSALRATVHGKSPQPETSARTQHV